MERQKSRSKQITHGKIVNRPFYSSVLSYLAMNASEGGGDLALIQTFCFSQLNAK